MKKYILLFSIVFAFTFKSNAQLIGTQWCLIFIEKDATRKQTDEITSVKFNADKTYKWGSKSGTFTTEENDDGTGIKSITLKPSSGLAKTYKVKYCDKNYCELTWTDTSNNKYVLVVCAKLSEI